jgi:hypothetical protein
MPAATLIPELMIVVRLGVTVARSLGLACTGALVRLQPRGHAARVWANESPLRTGEREGVTHPTPAPEPLRAGASPSANFAPEF